MDFFKKIFGKEEEKENLQQKDKLSEVRNEAALEAALQAIDKFEKTAYLPITKSVENQFNAKSKFGGFPYLRNENDWPVCPNCKKHQQLFLQLEMEKLPANQQTGLLQLFYCTSEKPHCESDLGAWEAFSEAATCRKITVEKESAVITPNIDEIFQEKIIIDWESKADFPHFEEMYDLELEFDEDIEEIISEEELRPTIQKDKFLGYPYWVQSVEYPFDRKTGSRMNLLFQIDSEDNLPYMFGDVGIGHITQSPDNENELAFAWACH